MPLNSDYHSLLKETIAHLQELSTPLFATAEEARLFGKPEPAKRPLPLPAPVQSTPKAYEPKPAYRSKETAQNFKEKPTLPKTDSKPASLIKSPSLNLSDQIPDDTLASRRMSAWQEYVGDVDVIALSCDPHALDLLKNLCKSIDQKLARAKILSTERLEQEGRWDLFFAKNKPKLIIASSGLTQLKGAMSYYKSNPATSEYFLGAIPLILLADPETYASNSKEKISLWNRISQALQK